MKLNKITPVLNDIARHATAHEPGLITFIVEVFFILLAVWAIVVLVFLLEKS